MIFYYTIFLNPKPFPSPNKVQVGIIFIPFKSGSMMGGCHLIPCPFTLVTRFYIIPKIVCPPFLACENTPFLREEVTHSQQRGIILRLGYFVILGRFIPSYFLLSQTLKKKKIQQILSFFEGKGPKKKKKEKKKPCKNVLSSMNWMSFDK